MKKLQRMLALTLAALCMLNQCAYAEIYYELVNDDEKVKNHFSTYKYIYEMDGISYKEIRPIDMSKDEPRVFAHSYDEEVESKLIEACGYDTRYPLNISYIHENGMYVVLNLDNNWDWFIYFPNSKLYYCDENFNLLGTEDFGGDIYIYDMGYAHGTYYCRYREMINTVKNSDGTVTEERERYHYTEHRRIDTRDITVKSSDLKEWTETDEDVPQSNGKTVIQGNKLSRDGKEDFKEIVYETDKGAYVANIGKYIAYTNDSIWDTWDPTLSFSNDGIYFVNTYSKDQSAAYNMNSVDDWTMRVSNGNIIINDYLKINEAELTNALKELAQNTVAYVILNNKLLSFDRPPVIENGRLLVPMRFLFEQMGAEVEWDEETGSAKATLNNKTITFTPDSDKAVVNSKTVSTGTPARLIDGKTMVPLRFSSVETGHTVSWEEETRTAVID